MTAPTLRLDIFDGLLSGMPRLNMYRAQVYPELYPCERPMLLDNWPEPEQDVFGAVGRRWATPSRPATGSADEADAEWDAPLLAPVDGPLWHQSDEYSAEVPHYEDNDPYELGKIGYPDYKMFRDAGALDNAVFMCDDRGRWYRKGYEPGRTWEKLTRGRWYRTRGEHGQDSRPACRGDYERDTDRTTLYELHMETGGNWLVDQDARVAREQLEVCRHCGADLGLPRDEHDYVIRRFETQPQYCSDRCEAEADNRRDRQRRAGGKLPKDGRGWYIGTTEFDLGSVSISGVGELGLAPSDWNRLTPRSRPDMYEPQPGNCRDVFRMTLHEFAMQQRDGCRPHPKVHRWRDSANRMPGDSRLGMPWRQPTVWKITCRTGALAC
jgi:hypothetical protein